MSTAVFEPARKLLENLFKTGWGSRTKIKWDNDAFQHSANTPFVAFSVRWGIGQQVSIGPAGRRLERHSGTIVIQVFVPKNLGGKALGEHCDFAASLMRMQTLLDQTAGVEVEIRSPQRIFVGESGEFRQENVFVEIQVDALF